MHDNEAKTVYEYSDGERGSREIGKMVGVSHVTVQRYWVKWAESGIGEPVEKYGGGRFKRPCSLQELSILVPQPKSITKVKPLGEEGENT